MVDGRRGPVDEEVRGLKGAAPTIYLNDEIGRGLGRRSNCSTVKCHRVP